MTPTILITAYFFLSFDRFLNFMIHIITLLGSVSMILVKFIVPTFYLVGILKWIFSMDSLKNHRSYCEMFRVFNSLSYKIFGGTPFVILDMLISLNISVSSICFSFLSSFIFSLAVYQHVQLLLIVTLSPLIKAAIITIFDLQKFFIELAYKIQQ